VSRSRIPEIARGLLIGGFVCSTCSKAIAYTPAGITQDSIPYWIATIVWVIVWSAILAIVRRTVDPRDPPAGIRENQTLGDVWWPSDDLAASGSAKSRPTRSRPSAVSWEFGGSLPYAPGKLPKPLIMSERALSPAAMSALRPAVTVAGAARRPRAQAREGLSVDGLPLVWALSAGTGPCQPAGYSEPAT
jgi:hypothetical protein